MVELMVVLLIVAIGSALVSLALPQSQARSLSRDAERLASLLEAARAQSRSAGTVVTWEPSGRGFVFSGLPSATTAEGSAWPHEWLSPQTQAALLTPGAAPVVLGPDPVIGAQSILLFQTGSVPAARLLVTSDGLRPFEVANAP